MRRSAINRPTRAFPTLLVGGTLAWVALVVLAPSAIAQLQFARRRPPAREAAPVGQGVCPASSA